MRAEEFVIRGKTPGAAGTTGKENEEILNFSGFKPGYAYKLTEFHLYPSANVAGTNQELCGSITAGKTAIDPNNPSFDEDGLIATTFIITSGSSQRGDSLSVINDTFLITQNLILKVTDVGGSSLDVNWQCKFMPVKMSKAEEAVTNYKQFLISSD